MTFENADQIAAWVKSFGKKITGIYITTGTRITGSASRDFSISSLRYADTRLLTLRLAPRGRRKSTRRPVTGRHASRELPEVPVVPGVLNSDEILVDGQVVNLIHVGQGDIGGSTIHHVPSAGAVVAGVVVHSSVHIMFYEADEAKREAWIASIDAVAALNPRIDVAGRERVGAADTPAQLEASQRYLCDFTTLAKKGGTVEDLVLGMLDLHDERDQPSS